MKKILCLLLILMFVLCSCGKAGASSYEEAIDCLMEFSMNGDVSRAKKLAPSFFWAYVESVSDVSLDEMLETVEKYYDEKLGEQTEQNKITYEITNSEKIKGEEFEYYKSDILARIRDAQGPSNYEIKEIIRVNISLKSKASDGEELVDDDNDLLVVNTQDGWYVYLEEVGFGGVLVVLAYSGSIDE